ncbi:hypothetical protein EP10_002572 [Geobacillus icigianus]|uniref:Uncharacterized protein n=1 Tax=Geobacillus icigianus TaxID=1430331 RepID=A0ABU6BII7_9BACL|nr:hypothetical protein [Geobacillus icigianus]
MVTGRQAAASCPKKTDSIRFLSVKNSDVWPYVTQHAPLSRRLAISSGIRLYNVISQLEKLCCIGSAFHSFSINEGNPRFFTSLRGERVVNFAHSATQTSCFLITNSSFCIVSLCHC